MTITASQNNNGYKPAEKTTFSVHPYFHKGLPFLMDLPRDGGHFPHRLLMPTIIKIIRPGVYPMARLLAWEKGGLRVLPFRPIAHALLW